MWCARDDNNKTKKKNRTSSKGSVYARDDGGKRALGRGVPPPPSWPPNVSLAPRNCNRTYVVVEFPCYDGCAQ